MANSVDPDQTSHSEASDLGLQYLQRLSVPILRVIIVTDYYVLNFFMYILIMNHLGKIVNINLNDQRECIFMLFNFYI